MNNLRNEKINRIERKLLQANKVSRQELLKIVSAPDFFDQINARIEAELNERKPKNDDRTMPKVSAWNWGKIGIAFAGLVILWAGALSLIIFTKPDPLPQSSVEIAVRPKIQQQIALLGSQPPSISLREEKPVTQKRKVSAEIAIKDKTSKPRGIVSKVNLVRSESRRQRSETGEAFYPLAFAENLEAAKENGKIIRVELSRSSLLALGLNPPMEYEAIKIKTDLLIGSDGVAHGIRFVR